MMADRKDTRGHRPVAYYHGKRFYGRTQSEADARRDDYKYEMEHGIEQIKPITVREYAKDWLPSAKAGVDTKTFSDYQKQIDRLVSVLGDKQMSAVTPDDIKRVWKEYVGYSESTIKRSRQLYNSMFVAAMESGYRRTNPMRSVSAKPHKGKAGTHRAIEPWERETIETFDHRLRPALMLMLYAGLRRGEMLAFTDKSIKKDKIVINEAVKFVGNKPVLSAPKTRTSVREIPIVNKLKPYLDGLDGYILKNQTNGGVCSESAFDRAWASYKVQVEKHLRESKSEHTEWTVRPHDLRHSYTVWLIEKGIDLKTCMKFLGHADEKMILQIYDHVSTERIRSALDKLNA